MLGDKRQGRRGVVRPGLHLANGFPRNFANPRPIIVGHHSLNRARPAPFSEQALARVLSLTLFLSVCLSLFPLHPFASLDRDNLQF